MPVVKAAAAYFAIVFAIGFVLGTIRVLLVIPQFGPLAATLIELPLMLIASWFVARWTIAKFAVPADASDRLLMGTMAFALLMIGETLLGLGFGRSLAAQWADLQTPAGLAGLAGQTGFALLPLFHLLVKKSA